VDDKWSVCIISSHCRIRFYSTRKLISLYRLTEGRKMSRLGWLFPYRDDSHIRIQWSPIPVLTGPAVEQLHWWRSKRCDSQTANAIALYRAYIATHFCNKTFSYRHKDIESWNHFNVRNVHFMAGRKISPNIVGHFHFDFYYQRSYCLSLPTVTAIVGVLNCKTAKSLNSLSE